MPCLLYLPAFDHCSALAVTTCTALLRDCSDIKPLQLTSCCPRCVLRPRADQGSMDAGATRVGMACKRKLQWPGGPSIDKDATDEAAAVSPIDAACWSPEPAAAQEVQQGGAEQQGEVLLRSPTHEGAVLNTSQPETKRARLLDMLDSSSLAGPVAAAAGIDDQQGEYVLLQQLPPAATSSSRRTWELLFEGPHQPGAAAAPVAAYQAVDAATPAAAAAAALPLAPLKHHAVRQARHSCSNNSASRRSYKASRALPGMTPSSASELQQLRLWLTALEAR
eukprot:GHRQ01006650.1.p1 GENE.GHRQ01006650.1~~GHRQ01006650.1.p1  ORF type:complete len:279 (+),score=55.95 GHRQ01006650.1:1717-2553(+)